MKKSTLLKIKIKGKKIPDMPLLEFVEKYKIKLPERTNAVKLVRSLR